MGSSFQEFAHLRIPLEAIKSITDDFADEHIIGRGAFGNVYRGRLLHHEQLVDVAIKRLDTKYGQGYKEFWNEISTLSRLKHENLISVVGFCDEGREKIISYEYAARGSLDKYLSDPITLTWLQRLHICVGVARALSFIHYDTGRNYGVIHRDIKSGVILLDENWEAKVSDFGLHINNPATRRHRLILDSACGTIGYVDPVYVETGTVTHKSDVYSFGVVLFEVLCGRLATIAKYKDERRLLAPTATRHYEEGKLDEMIDPNLRNQMHPESFKVFSETAYHCLKRQRAQRPDMEKVAKRLEKAWEIQWKHEHSKTPVHSTSSSNHFKEKNLEHMRILLADIQLATDNFSETYCIGSGGYGKVYKAELNHFDRESLSEIEGKNKSEFPKRRSTVAIKRIFSRADGQGEQSFLAEIELLTRCKHPNVVSLLGFCDEGPQQILVYEHASSGSLDDYLGNTENMTTFSWVQRIKICLDIANGLNYLHSTIEEKQMIIHRDIKSANILLGKNWEAKIADFGLSRIQHANKQASTLDTYNIAGTDLYLDPEYLKTGKLRKESDIYSFGVVLFEILCGRLAYDESYNVNNDKGLPSTVRRFFNEGILMEIVDPRLKEETDLNSFSLNRGPNQDSLDAFLKIAYQCLAETRANRPTMEVVIKELEIALYFQENNKDKLQISLEDIKLATQNFSDNNLIGRGGFGTVYKGEVTHANGHQIIAAKRLDRPFDGGEPEFLNELEVLLEYKNDNVIGLVGYCDEMDEKITVYEYAARGTLARHLGSTDLTWTKRLKICIDVASGLEFLHGSAVTQDVAVIHRDIKSDNILLTEDWKAKITDFGLSLISPINQEVDYVINNACGTAGYCDPLYIKSGLLTKESDIYSFGVVLFELLCGRYAYDRNYSEMRPFLPGLVRKKFGEGKLEQIVFEDISDQIVPESLAAYSRIAYQCLHNEREKRPTISHVLTQLKKALEFQEDYEIWEPKLPRDYKEIIKMSKSPEIYSAKSNKDLFNMFSKGILLQEGKVWFSLGADGERHEMISARKFSYKNRRSHKWRSILETRFEKVAEMLDISKLKTQIKITTRFLSPGVNYGVYLVFKFCIPRTVSSTPMYVNLTYKRGNETLHSYFATWRDDGWMMIELCRFLTHKEEADIEILLESFSRYYCKSGAIYMEGIEFRAIDNASSKVKHEEIEMLKEVQQVLESSPSTDEVQQSSTSYKEIFTTSENYDEGEKLLSLDKMNKKKSHMLSARDALYDSSNVKLFTLKPSADSRFTEVIELLSQQVLHIKCKIERQMLSPNTAYMCYLVFNLSEKGCGLNCPVIVRDLLMWKNKETEVVYFRSPSPLNCHHGNRVPQKREDGWMEVSVWKFNSNQFKNDGLPVNLKLICYEGTMSGLIVHGLEFRPV